MRKDRPHIAGTAQRPARASPTLTGPGIYSGLGTEKMTDSSSVSSSIRSFADAAESLQYPPDGVIFIKCGDLQFNFGANKGTGQSDIDVARMLVRTVENALNSSEYNNQEP